jgi:hypothetical protein
MSLFGSIGIGPVRIGASTRGGGSSMGEFLLCFIVVAPFYFAIKFWYVTLPILLIAIIVAALCLIPTPQGPGWFDRAAGIAEDQGGRAPTIAERADEQHAALMNGDAGFGTYGNYPPADL